MLMKLISGEVRTLCVVGDDDQSIYGWRGADIQNILRFDRHFPGAKVVKLETNYRSTGNILSVANAIIEKNESRHDKRLKPIAGPGDPVKIVSVEDDDKEAELVANTVAELIAGQALPKDVAVLFRSNVQSRPVELAFRTAGVPYRVAGGMDLFDKKEIKDLVAYLRVLDNPDDEQSLRRIVNYPPRGIGDTTIEKIDQWGRELGLSLYASLERVDEVPGVSGKGSDAVAAFMALLKEHKSLLDRRKPSTVIRKLIEAIGIEDVLFASSDSGGVAGRRVENVREIVRQLERFEERSKKKSGRQEDELEEDAPDEGATLSGFLADLALGARDDGTTREERDDQIVLSTIHAAKGLEWHHVFLVGAEEDLLPHARTIEGDGEIEEERRLAYVAVTRARAALTVTWAGTRTKWGRILPRQRSRFLDELPEECVVHLEDQVEYARTEEERDAVAQKYMASIRAKLGL
jgi:ATP-dependent DNA helicase Rep/DNA helicase-2/ATP-dependent DNA helicase PcrA